MKDFFKALTAKSIVLMKKENTLNHAISTVHLKLASLQRINKAL